MEELEQTRQLLKEVVELLKSSVQDRKVQTDGMMGILTESEERINRVNKMVADLTGVINDITAKYVNHLEQVCKCRDDLSAQNVKLLDLVSKQEHELSKERQRYEDLLKYMVTLAQTSKADTNINLK